MSVAVFDALEEEITNDDLQVSLERPSRVARSHRKIRFGVQQVMMDSLRAERGRWRIEGKSLNPCRRTLWARKVSPETLRVRRRFAQSKWIVESNVAGVALLLHLHATPLGLTADDLETTLAVLNGNMTTIQLLARAGLLTVTEGCFTLSAEGKSVSEKLVRLSALSEPDVQ